MLEIVCGKPGRGKTSYVVAHILNENFKFNNQRYFQSSAYIKFMNNSYGLNLTPLPQRHVVSANFDIWCKYPNFKNYTISGWEFGVPNEYYSKTKKLIPFGVYAFDEAHKYFDSKYDKSLPPWVTQAFELRRHISLQIYLMSQRYIRIHKDIREIADVFTYVDEITHTYIINNKKVKSHVLLDCGQIIKTEWKIHQFECEDELERYIKGDRSLGVKGKYEYIGDINQHYDTHAYASVVEDLKGDFSYYDYNQTDNRPKEWDTYKKQLQKEA